MSGMLLMVEDAGTRNVVRRPIITGPKSKAATRSLVIPMNVTSISPPLNASIMSAGLWIGTNSCGTPRRRASSLPISGLQPLSCPSCVIAKYDSISTPTRSLPLGANCLAVSAALCAPAPAAKPKTAEAAMNTAAADDRVLMSNLSTLYRVLERAHPSAELAEGASQGSGSHRSSPRPPALAGGSCAARAVGRVPRVLHARAAGARGRRHHALLQRVEDAGIGAIAAGIHYAPGAIGFGAAWPRINRRQRTKGEQDCSNAR